ncbi:uncharacterized DUF497 family protein [Metapseudomonas resinovorans]|uniref:BrnT family toxin n=1 Tax=Metapseudomonas resinovorans TaxID=53412 RepID=UPI003D1ED270
MKTFEIQFDPAKAGSNFRKHKVRLADGEAVFYDEHMLVIPDDDHDEDRWIGIGRDATGKLLVVAYTYRDPNFVRLISVRNATSSEADEYFGN